MNVKILDVKSGKRIGAKIRKGDPTKLPSMQQGWRFNFIKHIKLPNAMSYVLVTQNNPNIIEGCLIFQMKNKEIPYMAYVEIAPHNKGKEKKYSHVGGCLIAYAYRQSLIHGKGDYRGMLFFDVHEPNENDQVKLMSLYSKKFNAKLLEGTTMLIMDEDELIDKYLNS